jgi:hypothetical protein
VTVAVIGLLTAQAMLGLVLLGLRLRGDRTQSFRRSGVERAATFDRISDRGPRR